MTATIARNTICLRCWAIMTQPSPTRILILGSGFGGTYTAVHLERLIGRDAGVEVTLVSRHNYYLMTPLLFEAGSGVVEPRHAVNPLRALFRRVRFIEAEVESIDLKQRIVRARHRAGDVRYDLPFDQLVLALGGITNTKIIPGAEHALTFKSLADAIFLRNHVIDLFERADAENDIATRRQLLSFVIIGGGLVGVELMGELTTFVKRLCRQYKRIESSEVSFHLIEAGERLLPDLDPDLVEYAAGVFKKRGVKIYLKTSVQSVEPLAVHLPDGSTIRSNTIIAASGVTPNPLVAGLDIEKDRKGRAVCEATMRVKNQSSIWALGDCASIPDPTGKPYPALAQHALREARVLAENIYAALNKRPLKPFVYQTLGTLALLGDYQGIGKVMGVKIRGFLAWWVWRTYYMMQMPRFERKLRLILDWTVALFFKNDIVELDLFGQLHPAQLLHHHSSQ